MSRGFLWTLFVVGAMVAVPGSSASQEDTMIQSDFVVMPHMKGSLALPVSSLTSAWFKPAGEETPVTVRVTSQAMSEAKVLSAGDAEAVWLFLKARNDFIFVSHMAGTLAIPRATIRTAYYSDETGVARLRLTYDGDPSGKTIDGDEADRIWSDLQR